MESTLISGCAGFSLRGAQAAGLCPKQRPVHTRVAQGQSPRTQTVQAPRVCAPGSEEHQPVGSRGCQVFESLLGFFNLLFRKSLMLKHCFLMTVFTEFICCCLNST